MLNTLVPTRLNETVLVTYIRTQLLRVSKTEELNQDITSKVQTGELAPALTPLSTQAQRHLASPSSPCVSSNEASCSWSMLVGDVPQSWILPWHKARDSIDGYLAMVLQTFDEVPRHLVV